MDDVFDQKGDLVAFLEAPDAFADEVMTLLNATSTPAEVCVERVLYFCEAEAKGRFDEALQMLVKYS